MNERGSTSLTLILAFGVVACSLFFWVADSAIDSIIFNERTFVEQLVSPSPVEIWIRTCVATLFIGFGVVIRHFNIKAMRVKDIYLREIHHRTKNNLAVVTSLLDMTKRADSDINTNEVLSAARNRVHSVA